MTAVLGLDGTAPIIDAQLALEGAILTVVAAAFAPITIVIARRLFPGRRVFFARWGFSHVVLAAAVHVLLSIVVGATMALASAEDVPIEVQLVASAFVQGAVVALIFYWAHKRDPAGIRSLGLWQGRWGRAALTGVVVYLMCLPGLIGLILTWPWLVTRLGEVYEPQSFVADFQASTGAALWLAVGMAIVVIPLLEEILFRGFLQPLLVQNFRDKGGIVLTSALFAVMHGTSAFLPIFGLSLILGAVMLRTQRIAAVWAIHALHNGLQVALLLSFEN